MWQPDIRLHSSTFTLFTYLKKVLLFVFFFYLLSFFLPSTTLIIFSFLFRLIHSYTEFLYIIPLVAIYIEESNLVLQFSFYFLGLCFRLNVLPFKLLFTFFLQLNIVHLNPILLTRIYFGGLFIVIFFFIFHVYLLNEITRHPKNEQRKAPS